MHVIPHFQTHSSVQGYRSRKVISTYRCPSSDGISDTHMRSPIYCSSPLSCVRGVLVSAVCMWRVDCEHSLRRVCCTPRVVSAPTAQITDKEPVRGQAPLVLRQARPLSFMGKLGLGALDSIGVNYSNLFRFRWANFAEVLACNCKNTFSFSF